MSNHGPWSTVLAVAGVLELILKALVVIAACVTIFPVALLVLETGTKLSDVANFMRPYAWRVLSDLGRSAELTTTSSPTSNA